MPRTGRALRGDSSSSSEAEEEDVNLKECQQKLARYVACNMQRKHINRSEIRQLFPSKLTPNEWTAVLQGANDLLKDVFGLKLVPSESGKQGAMILISLLRPIPSQHCVLDGSYTSGEAAALSMILLHLFLSRKNETTPEQIRLFLNALTISGYDLECAITPVEGLNRVLKQMEKDLYIVIESQADAEDPTVMNHKVKLGERIKRQNIDVMDIFRKVAEIMNYRSVMEMINMHFPEHRPQPNRQQQPGVLDVTEGGASQISHPGIPMATSTPFPETSSQFLNTYRPKRLPR